MTSLQSRPELRRRDLVGLGLVVCLVSINSTMIAVALPDIADDFEIAVGTSGILVTVYLVVMLVGQPLAGRLTDRLGGHRLIGVALVGFAVTSVAAALAPSFAVLVVARSAQAVCAAVFVPGSQAVLRLLAGPERRGQAFGVLGSFIGVGAAVGPVLGGAVVSAVGWAGVFLVNLPIVAAALVLLAGLAPPEVAAPAQHRASMPPASLWSRSFAASFITQASTTFGQYSLLLVVPIVLDARGWSAGAIGAGLTALMVGLVVMGPLGGRFGDRHGRRRPVVMGTTAATAAAVLAAATIEESSVLLVVAMLVFGVGLGFAMPNITTAALESVSETLAGSASGVLSMSRYVGSIPSTILLAVVVGDDGSSARTFLVVAAVIMTVSVLMSSRFPTGAKESGT